MSDTRLPTTAVSPTTKPCGEEREGRGGGGSAWLIYLASDEAIQARGMPPHKTEPCGGEKGRKGGSGRGLQEGRGDQIWGDDRYTLIKKTYQPYSLRWRWGDVGR